MAGNSAEKAYIVLRPSQLSVNRPHMTRSGKAGSRMFFFAFPKMPPSFNTVNLGPAVGSGQKTRTQLLHSLLGATGRPNFVGNGNTVKPR